MNKHRFLFVTFVFTLCAKAQITVPTDIPSPNAADLGEFGNVPVSYYTGKADISIPLFTHSVKGVSLPISLAYNAGGVMINKLPGWTGENWALRAGGVITRRRRGQCDELVYHPQLLQKEMRSYFQSYSLLGYLLENTFGNYQQLKDSLAAKDIDMEPDVFCFNFMGHSGEFFLGNDGQWKVASDENLDVIFNINDTANFIMPFISDYPPSTYLCHQPKTIKGFTIRDVSGMEYVFGGSCEFIEYTHSLIPEAYYVGPLYPQDITSWTANSWYLKEVKDRFGNTLYSFTYNRGYYVVQLCDLATTIETHGSMGGYHDSSYCCNYEGTSLRRYGGTLNAPIYLNSISAADGFKIEFKASPLGIDDTSLYSSVYGFYDNYEAMTNYVFDRSLAAYYLVTNDADAVQYQYSPENPAKLSRYLATTRLMKLDEIVQKSVSGEVFQRYCLEYDTLHRMHLTSVALKDRYGTSHGRYSMTYDSYGELPSDYITNFEDHWGFYKGSAYTLPPSRNQGDLTSFYSQRNPTSHSKKGMLTQIKYPTGGRTVFEYENHDFSQYVASDRQSMIDSTGIAGGVRIKSITEYDDDTSMHMLKRRTFTYIDPQTIESSGQLYALPRYYWDHWQTYNKETNAYSYLSMFKNLSILPLFTSSGPHIGYSYVRETYNDDTYKEFRYSDLSSEHDYLFDLEFNNGTETPYDKYSSREYRRGRLLSVRTCDSGGNVLQTTDFQYRTDNADSSHVLASSLAFGNISVSLEASYDHLTGGVYKLFYPKYDTVSETCTKYYPSGNIVDVKTFNRMDRTLTTTGDGYTHMADIRTTTTETLTRGNKTSKTVYTYPFDMGASTESLLASSSFFLQPTAVEKKENGVTTHKQQTTYMNYQGIIVPQYEKVWANGQSVETVRTYLTYNTNNGNLLTYQDQGRPVTTLEWAPLSFLLTKKSDGEKHYATAEYNLCGQPSSTRDVIGNEQYYTYDDMGRLTKIENSLRTLYNRYKEKEYFYNFIYK